MTRFFLMCILAFIMLVWMGIKLFANAQTKQELAYDVISAQLAFSHYEMQVLNGEVEENGEKVKALGIDIDNACLNIVDPIFHNTEKFYRVCKINVCFQAGIPFNSCK